MLYAKIAIGLPVFGPFDYIVPDSMISGIAPGERVWVSFGTRRLVGYVVGLSRTSQVKKLKPILELIDSHPILSASMLKLTRELAGYYYSSWGEAIETAIPESLRKGKRIDDLALLANKPKQPRVLTRGAQGSIELLQDLDGQARWDIYASRIKETLEKGSSAVVLFPDIPEAIRAGDIFRKRLGIEAQILYRKQPNELEEWLRLGLPGPRLVIGTRSAVFAPLSDPGLVIIDEEDDFAYKQDQAPHYHARLAALWRTKFDQTDLILGSSSPSLESFYLCKKKKARHTLLPRKKDFPEIKIVDTRRLPFQGRNIKLFLSRLLEEEIYAVLSDKGKALLFLNRKGFATSGACQTCGKILKCPRCNINLVYHFKDDLLSCHYCNYKIQTPSICPECNAGYIKFSGSGTEKVESEIARIFPQARLKIIDEAKTDLEEADIFIATSSVIKQESLDFSLIGVLGIDNALNRVDFRATEKVFGLLSGLLRLTSKKFIIQTFTPRHHCFQAILKKDAGLFYEEELKQRRQLGFPPYRHMIVAKLRGRSEEKVKDAATLLFNRLREAVKDKGIEVISVNPYNPAKLRGNYYWQVLLRSAKVIPANSFLKNNLKDFRHSGIIVTVDVDPI